MFFRSNPQALSRKQREFWQRLNVYIREAGGWIISQPDVSPIRFECQPESDLPELLRRAGHPTVRFFGTHQRLLPTTEAIAEQGSTKKVTTRQHVAPGVVGVWQFDVPSLISGLP